MADDRLEHFRQTYVNSRGGALATIEDLVLGTVSVEQLSYEEYGHTVDGEEVLRDVIKRGVKLSENLWREEMDLVSQGELEAPDYAINQEYFLPHRDPDYRSAAWD